MSCHWLMLKPFHWIQNTQNINSSNGTLLCIFYSPNKRNENYFIYQPFPLFNLIFLLSNNNSKEERRNGPFEKLKVNWIWLLPMYKYHKQFSGISRKNVYFFVWFQKHEFESPLGYKQCNMWQHPFHIVILSSVHCDRRNVTKTKSEEVKTEGRNAMSGTGICVRWIEIPISCCHYFIRII